MGFLRNIAFKTAVKKSLLDVTEGLEKLQADHHNLSFGDAILSMWNFLEVDVGDDPQNWETMFYYMVVQYTRAQLTRDKNFGNEKDREILFKLIGEWVLMHDGDPLIIGTEKKGKVIISCVECYRKMRVAWGKKIRVTCPHCNKKFINQSLF